MKVLKVGSMPQILRGVEVFASGVYRGERYTPADVKRMAHNANRDLVQNPAVVGHEEEDKDGNPTAAPERTDVPADGWVVPGSVKTKWRQDNLGKWRLVLMADIGDLDDDLANDIKRKKYRKVSAEIYDDFTDDHGTNHGKTLRRVALLGSEIPQVKSLADLPMPSLFSERTPFAWVPTGSKRNPQSNTVTCFAETTVVRELITPNDNREELQRRMPGIQPETLTALGPDILADLVKNVPKQEPPKPSPSSSTPVGAGNMGRAEMIAALVGMGEDQAALESMSDEELAAFYAEVMAMEGGGGSEPGTEPVEQFADPAGMSREELIAACVAAGATQAECEAMSDDELRKKLGGGEAATGGGGAVTTMGSKVMSYSEKADRLAQIRLRKERVANAADKRNLINKFCEDVTAKGVPPAWMPWFRRVLSYVPNDVIKTFAEGDGKVSCTPLDSILRTGRRDLTGIVKLGERFKTGNVDGSIDDPEKVQKNEIRKYSEAVRSSAWQRNLEAQGKTAEECIEEFTKIIKKVPTTRAKDFLPEHLVS